MHTLLLLGLLSAPVQEAPPGLVLVEGSRKVVIGTDKDVLEELIRGDELLAGSIASEYTSKRKVEVSDFYLMPTEVTNEQYYVFVRATGHRPPFHWGEEAVLAAEDAHRAEILSLPPDERPSDASFDRLEWWDAHWEDNEWDIPDGLNSTPVTWVSYQDAEAYATWAGLRLQTEFEFQAAGRGDEDQDYPWGEEWDSDMAVTSTGLSRRITEPKAVGSAPKGATGAGVHDLIGNVWEWTASPFSPYEGYKSFDVKIGKKKVVTARSDWNANRRVVMGGCSSSGGLATRLSARRPTDRFQRTSSMGFRCASDVSVGNAAGLIGYEQLGVSGRRGVNYALDKTLGMDQWYTGPKSSNVAGYEVITGYDFLAFVPVEELEVSNVNSLNRISKQDGPMTLGLLTTTVNIVEPALSAGSYTLAYRGPGKFSDEELGEEEGEGESEAKTSLVSASQEQTLEELIDPALANLLIYDSNANLIAAMPVGGMELKKADSKKPNGKLEFTPYEAPKDAEPGEPRLDTIKLTPAVPTSNRKKPFHFEMMLRTKAGHIAGDWRM